MPFVLAREGNELRVDFGAGEFVTFRMREDAGNLQTVRLMIQKEKRATLAAGRIESLSAQAQKAKDNVEYAKFNKEIEELASEPDNASVLVDLICSGAETWIDCFADNETKAAGQVMEFSKANVEKLPLGYLTKIGTAFMKHFGLVENAEPGEAKGISLVPSQSEARVVPGNSQIGIETSAQTAQ